MNGGAVSARMNMKIAAELLHSGDHPWNANPGAEPLPARVSGQDCSIRLPCELGSGLARLQIGVNTEVLPTLMLLRILSSSAHKSDHQVP